MCDNCIENGKINKYLEEYYHACPGCGVIPEHGECECAPDEYIKPGDNGILYVNAYEVSRHFGGREEGGWWYNHHEPLASIPIKAISIAGHSNVCNTCCCAREGLVHYETGERYELCKWAFQLMPADPNQAQSFKNYLEDLYGDQREGDIYSVLGGTDIMIVIEDHPAERTPRPRYE